MARKWAEVYNDERYQSLDEGEKARAKVGYFNEVVRPNIADPDELTAARQEFFSYANGLEAPKQEGLYEGFIKPAFVDPIVEGAKKTAAPIVEGAKKTYAAGREVAGGLAGAAVGGVLGGAKAITSGLEEGEKTLNQASAYVKDMLPANEYGKYMEEANQAAMYPMVKAGEGAEWAAKQTNIPYAEPTANVLGQIAAGALMGKLGGAAVGKAKAGVKSITSLEESLANKPLDPQVFRRTVENPIETAEGTVVTAPEVNRGFGRTREEMPVVEEAPKGIIGSLVDKVVVEPYKKVMDTPVSRTGESFIDTIGKKANVLEGETLGQGIQRNFQDSMAGLKRWEADVFPEVPKEKSAYFAEERMHGKVADDMTRFENEMLNPLKDEYSKVLKETGLSTEDFDHYIKSKAAPRRNEVIQDRNQQLIYEAEAAGDIAKANELRQKGSGYTNSEAADFIRKAEEGGYREKFDQLAEKVYDINQAALKIREDFGLISKEEAANIRATYGREYVPFKGLPEEGAGPAFSGMGGSKLGVKASGIKSALGRASKSEDAVVHSIMNYEQAVQLARKSEVGNAFLSMAEEARDPGITINEVTTKRRINKETGQVEEYNGSTWTPGGDPNVFPVIRDGKHYDIRMDDNPMVIRALNSKGNTPGLVLQTIGTVTRAMGQLLTRFNAEFIASNMQRDFADAMQGISTEQSGRMALQAAKNVPSAMKAAYQYFHEGKISDPRWAGVVKEWSESGGRVGFYSGKDYTTGLDNLNRSVQIENALGAKSPRKLAERAFKVFDDGSQAVENATRIATYDAMRQAGKSVADASSYSKNVTINFNRRGENRALASLYMFFNPGVQGLVRLKQMVTTKRGMKILGAMTATFASMDEMNRVIGGQDEYGNFNYDKLSTQERNRNLILMDPRTGKPGLKYALGYLQRGAKAAATAQYDLRYGVKNGSSTAMTLLDTALDILNPIGGSSGPAGFTPAPAKPLVDLYLNKNFMGNQIRPEQPQFGPEKPRNQLAFRSVSPESKAIAEYLSEKTGGNAGKGGAIDISPEDIDYAFKTYLGGPGKTILQLMNIAKEASDTSSPILSIENAKRTWNETSANEMPIINRFTGANTDNWARGQFFEASKEFLAKKAEVDAVAESGADMSIFNDKDYEMYGIGEGLGKLQHSLSEMAKAKDAIKRDPGMSPEQRKAEIKDIEAGENEIYQAIIQENKRIKAMK